METTAKNAEVAVFDISSLMAVGLTEQEIAGISEIKKRYQEGNYEELTQEFKRLEFAKWLYEHNVLKS